MNDRTKKRNAENMTFSNAAAYRRVLVNTVLFVSLFPCLCLAQLSDKQEQIVVGPSSIGAQWVSETLKGLTLEEKVGQMLQIRYYADDANFDSAEYKLLRNELQKYHIGSLVFGMHFDKQGPMRSSALNAARVANQMQRDSALPLLLAADIERGVASRLLDAPSFPWPMAFGAATNDTLVEQFGAVTARNARAIGIHWALAPVADVNNNPANPVINTRSFGEDPEQVGALVTAFVRGAQENGLLVTATVAQSNANPSGPTVAERLGYPANARLLVIHADDFGMSHSVNLAIGGVGEALGHLGERHGSLSVVPRSSAVGACALGCRSWTACDAQQRLDHVPVGSSLAST